MQSNSGIYDIHFNDAPKVDSIPGPASRRLLEEQKRHDSGAVAYPKSVPIAFEEGRGATLRDVDGNLYLDFFAGIGVLNVGHSNPYVLEGANEQTGKLVHSIDFPSRPRQKLIEKLNEIAPGTLPGNMRVLFGGPTGSDAVEGSIKLAKYNTGGRGLIAFRGAYHGGTAGALSLTAGKKYKKDYAPLLPDVYHAPYPYPSQQNVSPDEAVERALSDVRNLLEDPYSGLANPAGIWVEPIQGEGGVVVPPKGFLSGLQELAEDHAIPLILDEIQTGFGRTGQWFASDWYDVDPDVVTMAKGIGGIGLPLGGMMYREDLDTWEAGGHVGTFRGNLPAMRAGVRAIEYIQEHDLLAHARELGDYVRTRLSEVAEGRRSIAAVRGKGLFVGIEFVTEDDEPDADAVEAVQQYCYERGVLIWTGGRYDNVVRLIPPLVLTREQAEVGLDVIVEAIRRVDE